MSIGLTPRTENFYICVFSWKGQKQRNKLKRTFTITSYELPHSYCEIKCGSVHSLSFHQLTWIDYIHFFSVSYLWQYQKYCGALMININNQRKNDELPKYYQYEALVMMKVFDRY